MQSAWHLPSTEDKPSIQGTSALSPNDVCAGVCVTGVKYMCVHVSGRRQGPLGDTAHSWLNYSWPQNKKAAPSNYRPQDGCKSTALAPGQSSASPPSPTSSTGGRSSAAFLSPQMAWSMHAQGPGKPWGIRGAIQGGPEGSGLGVCWTFWRPWTLQGPLQVRRSI